MRRLAFPALLALVLAAGALSGCRVAPPPEPAVAQDVALIEWAYPKGPQTPLPPIPDGPQHVAGSALAFTPAQLFDDENPVDWFPDAHRKAPAVVLHGGPSLGRAGGPTPCGACHMVGGEGFLGTPNLAGLPAAYIVQQIAEYRSGRRGSSEAGRPATAEMIAVARKVTDAEAAAAAAYYAALPLRPRFRMVEADTAPAVRGSFYGWLERVDGAPDAPIRGRLVEVAEDFRRMAISDPTSGIVVHAPRGAVARGQALVASGGAAGLPCAGCHGVALKGVGEVPPLAGRSPTYIARSLWDIRTGARSGDAVAAMQAPAKGLSEANVRDVAAYLGSLTP